MSKSSNPKTVCIRHEPGYYDVKRDGKFIGTVTKVAPNKWIAYGNGMRYEATCLKHATLCL